MTNDCFILIWSSLQHQYNDYVVFELAQPFVDLVENSSSATSDIYVCELCMINFFSLHIPIMQLWWFCHNFFIS